MNPLAKALGTVLVLAAGTLGSTLDHGLLPDFIGLPTHRSSEGAAGNGTGNQTSDGNSTTGSPGGNSTAGGNQTAGGDGADGNETGDAGGNETAGDGNETTGGSDGNETDDGDDGDGSDGAGDASVCDFYVDEWSDDLTPRHHEWEWLVTKDVTSLGVEFYGYGGVPLGLGGTSEAKLVDGSGRVLARTGGDGTIEVSLERGTDYMANGTWRLVFDSSDALSDYYVGVHLGCGDQ